MKVLYIDCYSGISGDMLLGALIDLGVDIKFLVNELGKLKLKGYKLKAHRIKRGHLSGTKINIKLGRENLHFHSLKEIQKIINTSGLNSSIKKLSNRIFLDLARAESKVHDVAFDNVHFHQLGEVDTIVDIVGACIALKALKVGKCFSSAVSVGCGVIHLADTKLPNPAPATLELLKDKEIQFLKIKKEIVTPTGAAILKNISCPVRKPPRIRVKKIGYGAGLYRIKELPNFLRIIYGKI